MKKIIAGIVSILFCVPLAAQQRDIAVLKPQLSFQTGFFSEDLNWSIAGNFQGGNPNVLSELKWQQQQGIFIGTSAQTGVFKRFLVEGSFSYGKISAGKVTDSDFGENDRENRVFYASLKSREGSLHTANAGLGYLVAFSRKTIGTITTGFSYKAQQLFLIDQSSDLHSSYKPNWNGWYLSVATAVHLHKRCILNAGLTYHQLQYKAKADWNLIDEFEHPVSFRHRAKGFGLNGKSSLNLKVNTHLKILLSAEMFSWQTGSGTDKLFLKTGSIVTTQLNEVNLQGFNITTGLSFNF